MCREWKNECRMMDRFYSDRFYREKNEQKCLCFVKRKEEFGLELWMVLFLFGIHGTNDTTC